MKTLDSYTDGSFKPRSELPRGAAAKIICTRSWPHHRCRSACWHRFPAGYVFMKMLLGALSIGLNAGLKTEHSDIKSVTREEAARYAFNTLKSTMVGYDAKTVVTVGNAGVSLAGNLKDVE